MPKLNYKDRIDRLKDRRYDSILQKAVLSESFAKRQIPEDLKYLAESMMPIAKEYNEKTKTAADNVRNHLEKNLNLSFTRTYRFQGSVTTDTNIKTHSDIDLLAIVDRYFYIPPETVAENPYKGDPVADINELRKQIVKTLTGIYDEVDDSGTKSISIYNKNLRTKVDIVPCYWYNSSKFQTSKDEFYRGVYLFDFEKNIKDKIDFPFAHITQVSNKGEETNDGLRKGIRLLKNLKADSDTDIKLSSFQLTSIVYSIDSALLKYSKGSEIKIAQTISDKLEILIKNKQNRKAIKSPNGLENPLQDDGVESQLISIKKDLDDLIFDCREQLNNFLIKESFNSY